MGPKGDEGVQESEDHASAAAAALVAPATLSGTLLRIGFIPLVDCAPLIVAHEKGFAAAEGLRLDLVRETSWANIRDRVALGHFDAAHMLAPMTIAATCQPLMTKPEGRSAAGVLAFIAWRLRSRRRS